MIVGWIKVKIPGKGVYWQKVEEHHLQGIPREHIEVWRRLGVWKDRGRC